MYVRLAQRTPQIYVRYIYTHKNTWSNSLRLCDCCMYWTTNLPSLFALRCLAVSCQRQIIYRSVCLSPKRRESSKHIHTCRRIKKQRRRNNRRSTYTYTYVQYRIYLCSVWEFAFICCRKECIQEEDAKPPCGRSSDMRACMICTRFFKKMFPRFDSVYYYYYYFCRAPFSIPLTEQTTTCILTRHEACCAQRNML